LETARLTSSLNLARCAELSQLMVQHICRKSDLLYRGFRSSNDSRNGRRYALSASYFAIAASYL